MLWMKSLADALTTTRLLLAIVLALFGLGVLTGSATDAGIVVLAAWTTDLIDGPLARKSGVTKQTWIGSHDLYIDIGFGQALLIFMCSVGLVNPLVALAYVLVWGIIVWRYGRVTKTLGAIFQGPLYIWFGIRLLVRGALVGKIMVLWLLGNIAVTFKRLTRRDLPEFIHGAGLVLNKLADRLPHGRDLES